MSGPAESTFLIFQNLKYNPVSETVPLKIQSHQILAWMKVDINFNQYFLCDRLWFSKFVNLVQVVLKYLKYILKLPL